MDLTELLEIAEKERVNSKPIRIRCCMAAGCLSSGSTGVKQSLEEATQEIGLTNKVEIHGVGCMGLCCQGSLVQVDNSLEENNSTLLYEKVTPENASTTHPRPPYPAQSGLWGFPTFCVENMM